MTCSQGTKNMLDLASKNKAMFFHTSTSEIYGHPDEFPQKESYWGHTDPIGFRSCYVEGKRFAESLIVNYQKKFGLNTKLVRLFNTYGPRMRVNDGRVMPNFINQAINNQPLTVYGDGQQTRTFCYVDDMIDGFVKMVKSDQSGPVNLGDPEEVKIIDLAKLTIRLVKSKSTIKHLPVLKDDPTRRQPDIALAKKKLGWQPKISLKDGLQKTINYFQSLS
jgi:UDP-glucuronate decarboxylase